MRLTDFIALPDDSLMYFEYHLTSYTSNFIHISQRIIRELCVHLTSLLTSLPDQQTTFINHCYESHFLLLFTAISNILYLGNLISDFLKISKTNFNTKIIRCSITAICSISTIICVLFHFKHIIVNACSNRLLMMLTFSMRWLLY